MKNEMNHNPVRPPRVGRVWSRWMVVDDNEEILNMSALFLGHAGGAAVYRFQSAEKALAAFRAAPEVWEMVLTDLEMPGMDGIELGGCLRGCRPDIKLFLMTGSSLIMETEAKRLGFCQLLYKPFRFSDLLRMLLATGTTDCSRVAYGTSHTLVGVAA